MLLFEEGEPTKFMETDVDQWWQPRPPQVTFSDMVATIRFIAEGFSTTFERVAQAIEPVLQARVGELTQAYKQLEPIIEVTQGHHAVCQHKPRCKPTPAWAEIERQVTQRRRGR